MDLLNNMPVKRRIMLSILATCTIVLMLACVALAVFEIFSFRQTLVRDLTVLADVLSRNTRAALAFQDEDAAQKTLLALESEPQVVAACLYTDQGTVFASYTPDGKPARWPVHPSADGHRFDQNGLSLFRPVVLNEKHIGTIYLRADRQGMYNRLRLSLAIGAAVLLGSILIALGISERLQRPISEPILALAKTARVIAERKDFTVRAEPQGRNEFGVLTDAFNQMLTQIHEQNQTVKQSEERVRAVLNSALSAVLVMDAGGKIIDWNTRAEQMFGWTRQEALGRMLADSIIPPRYREAHQRGLEQFLATGKGSMIGQLVEMNALRRDGNEFPVELSISSVTSDGAITFCGFIADITERKQAESKLQDQLNRMSLLNQTTRAIGERQDLKSIFQVVVRSLEDHLPVDFCCVCLYDPVGNSVNVVNVGERSGELAEEMAMTEQAHIPIDQNGLSRCVRGRLVYEPELDAVPFPFPQRLFKGGLRSLVVAPLMVESKVFGVLVTARRQANSFSSGECEFLRQLSEHVALAVHQSQLHEALQQAYDDLRQTQQAVMQQERLRSLGQMASGIAHDINNAVSPVALYTESLLDNEPNLSPRARNYLETIQRAIGDVAQTVLRMGEFYRQREPQLTLLPVHLNQLVQQVIDLTRARWSDMPQQRGIVIRMQTELASDPPAIMGVESEIREALINLVFNAVDALPEGGTITLQTKTIDGPTVSPDNAAARRVQIEVRDTGVGMSEDTRRKCLEPFFTTKGERGTGLGLAMVYGIVQRHSGEIEIESETGKGTTVRLSFAAPAAIAGPTQPGIVHAVPSRLRILAVDDDPLLLKSLRDALETEGHLVTAVNEGQAGIDTFRAAFERHQPFAVVITDLGMPYVDGRKVASSIKAISPDTPIILLTGWGQRLMAEGDVPPHVDYVLSKPPKLRDLREALSQCFRGRTGNSST